MLRELNENEMMMVSGGGDEVVVTGVRIPQNPHVTPEDAAMVGMSITEYIFGQGEGLLEPTGVFYNGNMYRDQGAADVARIQNERSNAAHGNDAAPNPGPNPQNQVPSTSPVQPVNTGTTVGNVGGVTIGVSGSGGVPPTGGSVSGSVDF